MSDPHAIIHVFQALLDAATKVGLAAAALFLAWAGFLYMTASGSPRRMESAKDAAFAAIGGLAVVLLAHTIAQLVSNAIREFTLSGARLNMRRHHEVPTHLNVEDKVLFGLTVRQFLYMLVGSSASYTLWDQLAGLGDPVRVALVALCVARHAGLCACCAPPIARSRSGWRPRWSTRHQRDARPGSRWSRTPRDWRPAAAAGRSWRRAWSGPRTR